jgi:hypothetical protein
MLKVNGSSSYRSCQKKTLKCQGVAMMSLRVTGSFHGFGGSHNGLKQRATQHLSRWSHQVKRSLATVSKLKAYPILC